MNTASRTRTSGRTPDAEAVDWQPQSDCGFRAVGWACVYGVLISLPFFAIGGWMLYSTHAEKEAVRVAYQQRLGAHERLMAAEPMGLLAVDPVVRGKRLFDGACAVCHKADGTGVTGLGKDLTQSWFAASLDDGQLRAFLARGRDLNDPLNTSRVPMPPKGGHDEFTDEDLADIVTFVRALQDPRRLPPLPESAFAAVPIAPPSESEKAEALAAAGGDAELAEYIASGKKLFHGTCIACHGKGGVGIAGNGKALINNQFVQGLDDDGLLAFIKRGRDPGDPKNTTGIGMPAKGGNPALSDDDLLDVISYLRTLQSAGSSTTASK